MVRKNEAIKQAWSQVDVVLQRRADLIPNFVATVKGYAQHEQTVYGDIANARAGLLNARTPADKIAANGQLDGASAGCWRWSRTIRILKPIRTSWACRMSWPEPRTASPSNAAGTTRLFRTTTPTLAFSPITSLPDGQDSNGITITSRHSRERAESQGRFQRAEAVTRCLAKFANSRSGSTICSRVGVFSRV